MSNRGTTSSSDLCQSCRAAELAELIRAKVNQHPRLTWLRQANAHLSQSPCCRHPRRRGGSARQREGSRMNWGRVTTSFELRRRREERWSSWRRPLAQIPWEAVDLQCLREGIEDQATMSGIDRNRPSFRPRGGRRDRSGRTPDSSHLWSLFTSSTCQRRAVRSEAKGRWGVTGPKRRACLSPSRAFYVIPLPKPTTLFFLLSSPTARTNFFFLSDTTKNPSIKISLPAARWDLTRRNSLSSPPSQYYEDSLTKIPRIYLDAAVPSNFIT